VHSWLQAAVRLHERGRLHDEGVRQVLDAEGQAGLGAEQVAGLLQDAVRRQLVSREHLEGLLEGPALQPVAQAARSALRWAPDPPPAPPCDPPDFDAFLRLLHEA
jgi:hypothetical protein